MGDWIRSGTHKKQTYTHTIIHTRNAAGGRFSHTKNKILLFTNTHAELIISTPHTHTLKENISATGLAGKLEELARAEILHGEKNHHGAIIVKKSRQHRRGE